MRFGNLLAIIVVSLMMHSSLSRAAMTINVTESGGDVIASANGTINTAGLTPFGGGTVSGGFTYGSGYNAFYDGVLVVSTAAANRDGYILNSPVVFSTGTSIFHATSNTGSSIGISLSNNPGSDRLHVPGNYVSNSQLSATSTWAGTTITALGLIPGTHVITWGSGENADSLTLTIDESAPPSTYTVGGTVSGLTGTGLVLQNNGGDDLGVAADGPFTFATALDDLSAYAVTVLTQPTSPNQTCTVSNGSGVLAGANVTNVAVDCVLDAADQTITGFTATPSNGAVGGSSTLSATASSGLSVTFGSSTLTICTVTGSTVSYLAVGTCTVTADQTGNASFNPAPQVTLDIGVGLTDQAITNFVSTPATGVVNGSSVLSATGGASGNPVIFGSNTTAVCTLAGSTVTYIAVGTCTVTADQAGDASFNAAPQVSLDITVAKADQAISAFAAIPGSGFVGGSSTLSATASSGLVVTFVGTTPAVCTVAGNTVTYIDAGTCTVTADQAGDANYNAAPQVSLDIIVTEGAPTPIPSLSVWGLVAMFLMMLGIGGMIIRRKTPGQ